MEYQTVRTIRKAAVELIAGFTVGAVTGAVLNSLNMSNLGRLGTFSVKTGVVLIGTTAAGFVANSINQDIDNFENEVRSNLKPTVDLSDFSNEDYS